MTGADNTPARTLLRAAEIGREAGLRYVYAGNLPGRVDEYENTTCHHCNATLVQRHGYVISGYHISPDGKCPKCGREVAGIWAEKPQGTKLEGAGMPWRI